MENADQVVALLQDIPLFAALPEADHADLVGRFHRRRYDRGEPILHHLDPGHAFFVLSEGSVKVTRPLLAGSEAVIDILAPGEFFGEMALLDGRPRSASVYALEPTEVIILYRTDFMEFLESHPAAAREIIVVLADRIRRLNDRIEDMASRDLSGRLARQLLELARERGETTADGVRVHLPMTQSELAAMVGVSRQRLNRALGEWQDEGIIRLERRNEVIILKPSVLVDLYR